MAQRVARLLLPGVNAKGAARRTVGEAVAFLERTPEPLSLFARVARAFTTAPGHEVTCRKSGRS